jgi:hypothetical protein
MFDAKIFSISLGANKTFLVNYLLDDFNYGSLRANNWSTSKTSYVNLVFPRFGTLLFLSSVI